jgi:integrase
VDRPVPRDHPLVLLAGAAGIRLWITVGGQPMTENSVSGRIIRVTRTELGRPINPHLFRDCAATFIAEEVPEDMGIVSRLLGHIELRTSEEHYNHAGALRAQHRHLDRIARLRGGDEDEVGPLAIVEDRYGRGATLITSSRVTTRARWGRR